MLVAVISRSSKADVVIERRPIDDNCIAIIAFGRLNRMTTVDRRTGHCRQLIDQKLYGVLFDRDCIIFLAGSCWERDMVCILFSNCIYRCDRINFHYAVETLLQLTDITMKKLKKTFYLDHGVADPRRREPDVVYELFFSHTQPRRHKIVSIYDAYRHCRLVLVHLSKLGQLSARNWWWCKPEPNNCLFSHEADEHCRRLAVEFKYRCCRQWTEQISRPVRLSRKWLCAVRRQEIASLNTNNIDLTNLLLTYLLTVL